MKVYNVESRAKLEMMYIQLELFNRIFQEWLHYMIPSTFIGTATFIIVATFTSIRYTHVPLVIKILFLGTAFFLMLIIFWMSRDAVGIVRDSDDILSKLLSSELDFMKDMLKAQRNNVLKRAQAVKKLELEIGGFAEFSMNLPVNILEACVIQLLFFLSLYSDEVNGAR